MAVAVSYAGSVQLSDIPVIMASHDVLIMPSRFEGLGMTMIEAMAGGCVPVVSHIRGVTDTIVVPGQNGFCSDRQLYGSGQCDRALARRSRPSRAHVDRGKGNGPEPLYSIERMAARYHDVISMTLNDRPGLSKVLKNGGLVHSRGVATRP